MSLYVRQQVMLGNVDLISKLLWMSTCVKAKTCQNLRWVYVIIPRQFHFK